MKFKYRNKISFSHILVNLVILTGFFYALFNANSFQTYAAPSIVQAYSDNLTVLKQEIPDSSSINVNNIFINNDLNGVITYIVQPWDNLSTIATNFWITVSHLKKVNNIRKNIIKPGQVLKITEENGFLYESKWETIKQLASKFHIKTDDLLEANGLEDINYKFDKWDEVFIPMSDEQYKKLFHKQIVKKPKPRPVIKQVTKTYKPKRQSTTRRSTLTYRWKNIIAKYRYRPNITNGFYRWHCTRYVAMKKFPYINSHRQKKLWNGNAKYWYANAKKAGYPVWKTPRVWAIVVIRVWWKRYYYAWHVAIIRQIDRKHKRLLVEEMNALWKYVVTKRWIPMNHKIIWYIYI